MLSDDINSYADLWENPSCYILVSVEGTSYEKLDHYAKTRYAILRKFAFGYSVVLVKPSLLKFVVERMIDAKVEIHSQWSEVEKEVSLERLWTDRVKEFVLVPSAVSSYSIYHKKSGEYVIFENISRRHYKRIIENMIKAGVKIWDKRPEIDTSTKDSE